MKRLVTLLLLSAFFISESEAQFTRYIVRLKNKGGTAHTFAAPLSYLSQRAIDRRTRYGIALDSTDLPVTASYINQIRSVPNVTILNVSKWLNAISIQTSDPNAINTINSFPFVQSVGGLAARDAGAGRVTKNKFLLEENSIKEVDPTARTAADFFNYGTISFNEIHLHHGEFLHNIGLRGQGMMIAMMDGGYFNYTTLRSFDSARLNGQILSTWDFVARHASVTEDHPHGMQCLSTIAANIPGQFIGKAPKANFHLFRTEDVFSEYPIEEHNWVCGAERADSLGSDVISSSLGYYDFDNPVFDYTYSDMNGNTTMSVIGADLAAKKGLIVFNAAGNEGTNPWHFLITPSDGDSVVAVGAVTNTGVVGGFSSYGPSADGQVKPDMASVGVGALIQGTNNTVGTGNGTSFACPNMAGLGTILWQGFPEFNNMKIIRALQQAGHKASNPDDRVGYGIPNMKTAFSNLLVDYATSTSTITGCRVTINWNTKDVSAMKYEIERKAPGDPSFTKVGELNPTAGAILANKSYQFNDDLVNGSIGNYTYRIRQILDTAASSFLAAYIDTTTVNIATGCVGTQNPNPKTALSVQPNPTPNNTTTLVVESPFAIPNMLIAIFDGEGRLMMQIQQNKLAGKKNIDLDLSRLAKGKYYIRVWDDKKIFGTAELLKL